MKRYPFLIIYLILLALPVRAQSIYELFLPLPKHKAPNENFNYGYLQYNYIDQNVIDVSKSNGEKYHIHNNTHSLKSKIDIDYFAASFKYRKPDLRIYRNYINEIEDTFKFYKEEDEFSIKGIGRIYFITISGELYYCKEFSYGLGMKIKLPAGILGINGSYKPVINTFKYTIMDETEKIPFDLYMEKKSIIYDHEIINLNIDYIKIKPLSYAQGFSSDIEGKIIKSQISCNLSSFTFEAEAASGEISAEFMYEKSPFAKLDKFKFNQYKLSLSHNWDYCSVTPGVTGFKSEIGKDSYLDIWPLTFWDMFMASRTRLDRMDIELTMPYLSSAIQYPIIINNIKIMPSISLGYYHLILKNKVIYRKKKWKVYPFLSYYEAHEYKIEPKTDGIMRGEFKIAVQYKNIELLFKASQLLPITFSKIKKPNKVKEEQETVKSRKRGGNSIDFGVKGFY